MGVGTGVEKLEMLYQCAVFVIIALVCALVCGLVCDNSV